MKIAILFSFLLMATSLSAQYAESLRSDRPGASMSPYVVGSNALQLQLGYGYQKTDAETFSLEDHLLDLQARLGITERWEVSLITAGGYAYMSSNFAEEMIDEGELNFDRLGLATRFTIFKGKGRIPAVGVEIGGVSRSVEEGAIDDELDLRAIVSVKSELSDKFSLTSNLAYVNDETYFTLNLGYGIGESTGVFVEVVPYLDVNNRGFFNFGGGHLLNENFRIDLAGGFLLYGEEDSGVETADIFYVQAGLTKRFDWRK